MERIKQKKTNRGGGFIYVLATFTNYNATQPMGCSLNEILSVVQTFLILAASRI